MGTNLADADGEKIERMTSSVTGLRELFEVLMMGLSADVAIPIRKLFGSPIIGGGLTKEGDEETQDYYDFVTSDRQANREEQVERLCRLIMLQKAGPFRGVEIPNWKIVWPPLREDPMETQLANKKTQSEIDQAYFDMDALDPEEIRDSRFGGNSFSHDTKIIKGRVPDNGKDSGAGAGDEEDTLGKSSENDNGK
jgi:uncharacterized protein